MLCAVVGFVYFYIFSVIVGVLNSEYCNVCSTVRYLACNFALIKCFIFQWLVVLIVRVTCHRWHKSWSHVEGIRWCAINWLVFVTETDCVYCAVRNVSLHIIQVNPSLYPQTVWLCISFRHQWRSRSFHQIPQLCSILPVQCLDSLPIHPQAHGHSEAHVCDFQCI